MEKINEFVLAKQVLQQEERMKLQIAREATVKCTWEDPEDRSEYLKSVRQEERRQLLLKIHPDLICPTCKQVIHHVSHWVISKDKKKALCRSCYTYLSTSSIKTPEGQKGLDTLFVEAPKRYLFDTHSFVKLREYLGVSAGKFASLCGWSRQYQNNLEDGDYFTINQEKKDIIQKVLEKLSI